MHMHTYIYTSMYASTFTLDIDIRMYTYTCNTRTLRKLHWSFMLATVEVRKVDRGLNQDLLFSLDL